MSLTLDLHFGGGAELLFDKIKKREIQLPPLQKYLQTGNATEDTGSATEDTGNQNWTIRLLLRWLKDNLLKEREELFLQGDSVRPGILVLVNDADWELLGELDYQLQDRDCVMFISTLHGG